jgi:hypothetical protein
MDNITARFRGHASRDRGRRRLFSARKQVHDPAPTGWDLLAGRAIFIGLKFLGANPNPKIEGVMPQSGHSNYLNENKQLFCLRSRDMLVR